MCITGLKCFCLSERAPLLLCMPVSNADCRGACCLQSSVIMPVPPHGSVWCAVLYGAMRHTTHGMVWYGMVWYGMVWYGTVRYGMAWYGTVRCGTVRYGIVRYGTVWYGMVLYCMVLYGMV